MLRWTYANPHWYTVRQRGFFPVYTSAQRQCWDRPPRENAQKPACKLGNAAAPADTILWGDSHSLALVPAIDSVFSKHGNAAMFAGMGGCPPLLDVQFRQFRPISSSALLAMLDAMRLGPRLDCKWHNDAVLEWVIQHKIKTVILAAHWIVYVDTHAVPSAVAAHMVFADTRQPDNGSPPDGAAVFARGFDRMLSMLQRQHVKVFVVDDI
jgi:hypothetical protein